NELNQDPNQRIVCENSAATGTRVTRPSCMTKAGQDARAREAADCLPAAGLAGSLERGLDGGAAEAGPVGQALRAGAPSTEAPRRDRPGHTNRSVEVGRDAYNANMERLLFEHPELFQAYDEYVEARRRFEAAQRR